MKNSTLNYRHSTVCRAFLSLACCTVFIANAGVVEGEVYTIVLANETNKTLFTADSSPDSLVCIWTETHVPAQQWRLVKADEQTYAFQNLYTGKYLSYNDSRPKNSRLGQTASVVARSKWTLDPVDAENNVYTLSIGGCSLCTADTADRRRPILSDDVSGYKWKEWKLVHVANPVTEFNAQVRDEMLNDFTRKFIRVRMDTLVSYGNGGWSDVETMEIILDAYEETHSPDLRSLFYKLYAVVKWGVGDDWTGGPIKGRGYAWYGDDYNDDVAWMLITAARAYHLFGKQEYLDDAKRNFDAIYKRAYVPKQGLIRWAQRQNVGADGSFLINSCVNGPMEVAACYIAKGTGDDSYYQKAYDLYMHQRTELADMTTGRVYDSYRVTADGSRRTGDRNDWASTYNQGTMMGAAVLLYNRYRDPQFKRDAEKMMEYVQNNMCDRRSEVINKANVDRLLGGFKGILMRYVRRLIVDCGDTQYIPWMKNNAFRAYNNRNSQGFISSSWLEKSAENMKTLKGDDYDGVFSCGTAVSAAVNVPLNANDSNGYVINSSSVTFEAELTKFKGGTKISRGQKASFGLYVGSLGKDNSLSFDYVAPQDGVYDVKVYYMTATDRNMYVSADGSENPVTFPNTGGWNPDKMGTKTIQLELKKGVNTIVAGLRDAMCPNVDKFEISLSAPTGIDTVKASAEERRGDDKWYNLQGQPVSSPSHGIYIHGGKKVVVK